MQLYLIRHAQSQNNILTADTQDCRKADPDLTDLGYQQRELLAQHIQNERDNAGQSYSITRLYTSAMYRSLLTSKPLGQALSLRPAIWLDLHEVGGIYQAKNETNASLGGMTRRAILSKFADYQLPEEVTEHGWYDLKQGWEPQTPRVIRAIKVAAKLHEWRDSSETIALVSHAGFLNILLCAIFENLPAMTASGMRYYHQNTAMTRIDYRDGGPTMQYMNRVEHLPEQLRSL